MFIKHFKAVKKEFENTFTSDIFELPHVEPIEYHSADAKNKTADENAADAAILDNSNATKSSNITASPPPADGSAPTPPLAEPIPETSPAETAPENLETAQKSNKTNKGLATAQK